MRSKVFKSGSIRFGTEKVCKTSLLGRGGTLRGFTLLEILMAVTIIVSILSMVYGSYFATAKSADAYNVRMAMSGRTSKVLSRMARQIRCSYIGKVSEETDLDEINKISKSPVVYFSYEDVSGSKVLRLVTTHRLFCEDVYTDGLFDVAYKYDKNIGTLYLSQRKFFGTSERLIEDRNWRPILENVEAVELDFFDGQRWLSGWDFEQKTNLPLAVKIGITCRDENYRQCHYGTAVYVDCSKNKTRKTLSEKLVGG